jgi:hypothetical protein
LFLGRARQEADHARSPAHSAGLTGTVPGRLAGPLRLTGSARRKAGSLGRASSEAARQAILLAGLYRWERQVRSFASQELGRCCLELPPGDRYDRSDRIGRALHATRSS